MRRYLEGMNRHRNAMSNSACLLRLAIGIAAAFLTLISTAHAASLADAGIIGSRIDLLPYLAALETDRREVSIEEPGSLPGTKSFMVLRAKGAGPMFRWVAGGFTNSGKAPRSMVIAIADQGFVGSGIYWPKPLGRHVESIITAGEVSLQRLSAAGAEAYGFTLEPGKTIAIAFEIAGPSLSAVTFWQREAFDEQKNYFAFFRGSLLGIAALLAVAMLALYSFRRRSVFLAASGFAVASLGFMLLEAGHLRAMLEAMQIPALTLAVARGLIEGLMAAFLVFYLVAVLELRRFLQMWGFVPLLLGGLVLAVAVLSFADPAAASGVARAVFGVTALAGFLVIFILWRRGDNKAEAALISWSAIFLWSFIGFVAILGNPRSAPLSPALLAGLCAVLVVMVFALVHHAFSKGLSQHFFREAGRRALALAGARAYVWDWQPEDSNLHVGEEIERALGLPPGLMSQAGVEIFLDLMHPSDRSAYLAAIELAEQQGNGVIEREFRLRHDDGGYRWFQLRGRGMPGSGHRAVRCIGTLTDVTSAKRSEERLLNDAVHDAVTGLPNRALFIDRVERALAAADAAAQSNVYILLADIDRFKTVNDALGHDAGDSLLTVLARRLTVEVSPHDSIARLPGSQFAILFLASESERTIAALSKAVGKAVALPITLDGQEIFLTACIGVAHNREPGLSAEQLLKDAALALYEAKRRGGGTMEVFTSAMRDDRAELVVLESELRRAIERNEIEVHYQPIARLADMNLAGFEALVRWRHPALGLLAPESFVGLAEQTGMIKDIGRAVLNEAGRQLGIWQRSFRQAEPVFIAVNISSAQLIETSLIDDIALILHREAVSGKSLKVEVTESLVMRYPELAGRILGRLKELGVGLSCDDFGIGHSSLSSLRKLPFDTLKVDRSFIAADAEDERAMVILESIVAMAHALGLMIVAEGIESQEQVDRLGALNCDLGQGYFIGRPMTARQVTDALAGLPYTGSSGRTAITWLWEKASKDPVSDPLTSEVTTAGIEESHVQQAKSNTATEKIMAEATAIVPAAEAETAKSTVPPLGSSPMAPRALKPAGEIAIATEQPDANGKEAKGDAAEPRKPRKRGKRPAADPQAKRPVKKIQAPPH